MKIKQKKKRKENLPFRCTLSRRNGNGNGENNRCIPAARNEIKDETRFYLADHPKRDGEQCFGIIIRPCDGRVI